MRVAVIALCAAGTTRVSAAQSRSAPGRTDPVTPVSLATWSPADSGAGAEVRLPTVAASGSPRSYLVVSVPVPDALSRAPKIDVELVARGEFVVLGSKTRTLSATGSRKVAVTIGIPASALAGHLLAAEARFSAPGTAVFVVPVEIDVALVRSIALKPSVAAINAQAGSDVILPFEIVNAGNAREAVEAELVLPEGWSTRELHQSSLTIDPGQTIKRRVRLHVPQLSSTGSSFIQINLRQRAEVLATHTATIEVFNSSSVGRQSGPLIVSAVSRATDENGRANDLMTLSVNGALYDSIRVDARFSQGKSRGGAASNAFSHLGSFQSSASVLLSAPGGQLSLGNTGTSFSELTGLYPYGEGALLNLSNSTWGLSTLGALSLPVPGFKREPMLGFRADHQLGDARVFASISHLADAGVGARKLEAAGIGAALPAPFGTTFKAEFAERRFDAGRGLGWSSELERTGGDATEQLRITHAPGGSDAFARATNELIANVSQKLTDRLNVSGSAWRTSDATAVFSGIRSNGLSMRPQITVAHSTTVALDMRTYVFDASTRPTALNTGGGFGNREQQLGISFSTYVRQYYFNTSAYLGNVTRTVSPVGQSMVTDRTPRNNWTTNTGWTGTSGILEFQTRIEQTRDAGGFVNQQSLIGVRAEQVVLPWLGGLRAAAELQRVNGFGKEKSSIQRFGASMPLIDGFALKVDVERNSIFRALAGKVPWVFGMRLEHALTVPMLRTPGTSGYVFQDLNGNQTRDANEPGVAGAIVRRGSESAVADGRGKYRVGGDAKQPLMVDEASLPDGWSPAGSGHDDVPLALSTTVEVELVVAPRSGFSEVAVDLSKAHIIARDSAGREWAARMTGPSTATFESLPVGTYTLEFDLSELLEPLVARSPVPLLVVSGKESRAVTVTLDPRPIRMWTPPSSRPAGAAKTGGSR